MSFIARHSHVIQRHFLLHSGQVGMNDYRGGAGTAVAAAWNLLRDYVTALEKRGQTTLHKAVVTKLMSLGAFLPAWLVSSYQIVNPAELLRLYLVRSKYQFPNIKKWFDSDCNYDDITFPVFRSTATYKRHRS